MYCEKCFPDPMRIAKIIAEQYGIEALRNKTKFVSVFSDLAPGLTKEKKAIRIAFEENINQLLLDADSKSKIEKEIAIKKSIQILTGLLAVQLAVFAVSFFTCTLDWGLDATHKAQLEIQIMQDSTNNQTAECRFCGQEGVHRGGILPPLYKNRIVNIFETRPKAVNTYQKELKQMRAIAQHNLGICYEYGEDLISSQSKSYYV